MAEQSSQEGEKTEDPSQHRIDEFRKRGEVASSKDLTSILLLAASIMVLGLSLVYIYETLSEFLEWLYSLDIATAYTEKSRNDRDCLLAGRFLCRLQQRKQYNIANARRTGKQHHEPVYADTHTTGRRHTIF